MGRARALERMGGLRFFPEGLAAFGTGCSKFALRLPSRGPAQDACSIFACVERCCGVSGSQDAWARTVLRLGLLGANRCTDGLPTQGAHSCAGGLFKGPAYGMTDLLGTRTRIGRYT